jgi:hypothetical protein
MEDIGASVYPIAGSYPDQKGHFSDHLRLQTGQFADFIQKTACLAPTICVLTNF